MIELDKQQVPCVDFFTTCIKYKGTLKDIFLSSSPYNLLRNLRTGRVLYRILPYTYDMSKVFQDKRRNASLLDHSLAVLKYTEEQTDYKQTLLAAFLHDYGKLFTQDNNFKNHDVAGIKEVKNILTAFTKDEIKEVLMIMKNHWRVSQYQRTPNWGRDAFVAFIKDTHPLTCEIIKVAKSDKMASHNYSKYLEPYDDFLCKIEQIYKEGIDL